MFHVFKIFVCFLLLWISLPSSQAQDNGAYEDYQSFATDPVDIDNEVHELFGRYFQTYYGLGSLVPTGDLGSAYSAGFLFNLKFVLYTDRIWAFESSLGFARLMGSYNEANTGKQLVSIDTTATIIPIEFGFRYGFDMDNLPAGIALMNPYLSAGPAVVFKSEKIKTNAETTGLDSDAASRFSPGATLSTTGYGIHFGGGIEFDIYRKSLFAGVEARYHAIFWNDADTFVGDLGRKGYFFSLLATINHNF